MSMKPYEFFEHTADVGIKVYAETLAELFENAAAGMFDIITDAADVSLPRTETLRLQADNVEELLVSWLSELLSRYDAYQIVFSQFSIKDISETHLIATVCGEPFDSAKHEIKTEIKAVTFHELKVEQRDSLWQAQIIFDL